MPGTWVDPTGRPSLLESLTHSGGFLNHHHPAQIAKSANKNATNRRIAAQSGTSQDYHAPSSHQTGGKAQGASEQVQSDRAYNANSPGQHVMR